MLLFSWHLYLSELLLSPFLVSWKLFAEKKSEAQALFLGALPFHVLHVLL